MSQAKEDIPADQRKTSIADELTGIKETNLDKRKRKKKKKDTNDEEKKEDEHKEEENAEQEEDKKHQGGSKQHVETKKTEEESNDIKEEKENKQQEPTQTKADVQTQKVEIRVQDTKAEETKIMDETGKKEESQPEKVQATTILPQKVADSIPQEQTVVPDQTIEQIQKNEQEPVVQPQKASIISTEPSVTEPPKQVKTEVIEKQQDKAEDLKKEEEKKESKQGKQTKQRKRRKRVFKDKEQEKAEKTQKAQEQPKSAETSHIVAHQPSFHQILEPTINHAQDVRILSDTAFSKKKENYNQLRQWSILRTQQISLHLSILNELQLELQRSIKLSLDHFEIYISFFRQRSVQEEKLITHPLPNVQYLIHNNQISKDIYINCSRLLQGFSQENYERCKRSQKLIIRIRKEILMELLEDHFKKTQLELMKIREKISTARSLLIKEGTELDKKITKLAKRHASYLTGQNHDASKDYLKSQLSFLRKAQQHCLIQRRLGQFIYEYLNVAKDEELKRSEVIKKSLFLYAEAMEQAYGVKQTENSLEQLSKVEVTKLIPQFYSVESLLDDKNLNLLRNSLSLNEQTEVTMEVLQQFLASYKFPHFNSRILILKEYPVEYETQHYKLIITVDHFIHLFSDAEPIYAKPHKSVRIQKGLQIVSHRDLTVTFKKEEKKGMMGILMWPGRGTAENITVRFQKRDALEEFEEYVDKLV